MALDMQYFQEMEAKIPRGKVRTTGSPPLPPATCTSATCAPPCTPGSSPGGRGGPSSCASRTPTRAARWRGQPSSSTAPWPSAAWTTTRGPTWAAPVAPYIQTQRRDTYGKYARLLVEAGPRLLLLLREDRVGGGRRRLRPGGGPLPVPEPGGGPGPGGRRRTLRHPAEDPPTRGPPPSTTPSSGTSPWRTRPWTTRCCSSGTACPPITSPMWWTTTSWASPTWSGAASTCPPPPKYDLLYRGLRLGGAHLRPLLPRHAGRPSTRCPSATGTPSYEDLRREGYLTQAILNYVALLGWSPRGELAERELFTPGRAGPGLRPGGPVQVPRHLRHRQAHPLQRPLPAGHGPGGVRQGRRALHPPEREKPRPGRRGDRRPAPGPVREAHRDPGEGGTSSTPLPDYDTELYTNKKSKCTPEVSKAMLEAAIPHAGGAVRLEPGRHPRRPGGPGRGAGGEKRHPHVAGAHCRRRQSG